MVWTKGAHQSDDFQVDFQTARMKINQILMSFFMPRVSFPLNFAWTFSVMTHTSPNLIYFGQKNPILVKFSNFSVVGWKFTKFLMSYLKPQSSFSLNFALLFSVMRGISSVLFLAETSYDLDKRSLSKFDFSKFHEEISSKAWPMWQHHIPQNIFFWKLQVIIKPLPCWKQFSLLLTGPGIYPQIYHRAPCPAVLICKGI